MANRRKTAKRTRYQREYMRRKRAAEKAKRIAAEAPKIRSDFPADPAGAIAEWSKEHLVIPSESPAARSNRWRFQGFGVHFLRDVFTHRESCLLVARKNAKSSIIAILLLAYLAENGPLRCPGIQGWRLLDLPGKSRRIETVDGSDLPSVGFEGHPLLAKPCTWPGVQPIWRS